MHLEEHKHCLMHVLASKHCLGHVWAPPFMNPGFRDKVERWRTIELRETEKSKAEARKAEDSTKSPRGGRTPMGRQ